MAIGKVRTVETRVVDWYIPVEANPGGNQSGATQFENTGQKIPWKFITLDVEKYLFDKTGKYADQITFRTPANECVDRFGMISPEKDAQAGATSEYHEGERAHVEITSIELEQLYSENGYKFEIMGDELQPSEKIGLIEPLRIENLEAEIAEQLGSQNDR